MLRLLDETERRTGMLPNLRHFNQALDACAKVGDQATIKVLFRWIWGTVELIMRPNAKFDSLVRPGFGNRNLIITLLGLLYRVHHQLHHHAHQSDASVAGPS